MIEENQGLSGALPFGPGCQPSASAADASSQSDIPNAEQIREELSILQHTLGLDRSNVAYRNYFSAGPGHTDMPILDRLAAAGLMVKETSRLSSDFMFHATKEGRDFLRLDIAQAIEARRAATGTGAVHESAVGDADAPETQS